jgi:Flp pilus assembly pilin Flp
LQHSDTDHAEYLSEFVKILLRVKVKEANKLQLLIGGFIRPLQTSGASPERRNGLRGNRGQAVIEYILILVIVVGIILSVMYQLNTAFKKYAQSYFGEYIACLLETGELPSLGSGQGASAEICSASFEPFSLKNGRPLAGSGAGEDGGGGSGKKAPRVRSKNSTSSASRGGSFKPSRVTRGMAARNGEAVASGNSSNSSKSKVRGIRRTAVADVGDYSYRSRRQRANGQIPISRAFTMEGDKSKEKASISRKVDAKGRRNGDGSRSKKFAIDMDKFRTTASAPPDTNLNLSLGDYMRYLLIGGLIIMIVIFFGGQLAQLKKSWEK